MARKRIKWLVAGVVIVLCGALVQALCWIVGGWKSDDEWQAMEVYIRQQNRRLESDARFTGVKVRVTNYNRLGCHILVHGALAMRHDVDQLMDTLASTPAPYPFVFEVVCTNERLYVAGSAECVQSGCTGGRWKMRDDWRTLAVEVRGKWDDH